MSLQHAILSLLNTQAKSGYDLAKEFSGSVQFYWQASHQQIYKMLAQLEAKKLVVVEHIEQSGKPDRKEFSLTPAGREELMRWVAEPTKPPASKNALLIKLLNLETVGSIVLRQNLQEYSAGVEQRLQTYRDIESRYFAKGTEVLSGYHLAQYLTLRRGISAAEAEFAWLQETIAVLQERSEHEN